MGKSLEETDSIIKEAKDYLNGNREYGSKIEGSLEYWNSIPTNPLTEFNLRLLSVLPHSAVVERLFSRMAYIKDKYQNRMAGSTLQSLTKLKLELKKDKNRKETGIVGVWAVPKDNETVEGERRRKSMFLMKLLSTKSMISNCNRTKPQSINCLMFT